MTNTLADPRSFGLQRPRRGHVLFLCATALSVSTALANTLNNTNETSPADSPLRSVWRDSSPSYLADDKRSDILDLDAAPTARASLAATPPSGLENAKEAKAEAKDKPDTVETTAPADRAGPPVNPKHAQQIEPYRAAVALPRTPLILPSKQNASSSAKPPGSLISLDFVQVPLREVLQAFARFTRLNIVISDAIKGEISIKLANVPWRQAFDVLLEAHGLGKLERGEVIWVAPQAELNKRQREADEAHARRLDAEPLTSRVFDLHYQRAVELHQLLVGSDAKQILSKRGGATADARSNRLYVSDIPSNLAQVARMIAAFDLPARQVLIEARVVEADDGFARNLGVRLGLSGETPGSRVIAPGGTFYDFAPAALSGVMPAAAAFSLFGVGADRIISLELSALEAQGKGKVLSSPRVVTTDRSKAVIEQGTELPYQARVRRGISGLQFRRASLRLEVTPHITPDHRVSLDVQLAKDTIGEVTDAGAAIDTKHISTQVEVENGGTVVIGGIFSRTKRRDVVGVPVLMHLPWIGALFRRTAVTERKTELIVFITPSVVEFAPPQQPDGT